MVGGRATLIGLLQNRRLAAGHGRDVGHATIRTATSSQKERGFESRR
jgi:hypothetical protein